MKFHIFGENLGPRRQSHLYIKIVDQYGGGYKHGNDYTALCHTLADVHVQQHCTML